MGQAQNGLLQTIFKQFQPQETHEEKKHCKARMLALATRIQKSYDDSGDVINQFEQNILRKALETIIQMRRFICKCIKRKTKFLMFVAPAELQEALVLLLRQEQH